MKHEINTDAAAAGAARQQHPSTSATLCIPTLNEKNF